MGRSHCTHVGTLDANLVRGPHLEYPSFENRCLAIDDRGAGDAGTVMLTDQATFCLSSGYKYCPRHRAALAAGDDWSTALEDDASTVPLASDWLSANLEEMDQGIAEIIEESDAERQAWGWIGAAIVFSLVFLCGGSFALFLGWQVVSGNLRASQAEQSNAQPAAEAVLTEVPVFLVITATPLPASSATAPAGAVLIGPTPTFNFPAAVTATPALVAQTGPAVGSSTGGIGPATAVGLAPQPATPVVVAPPTDTPIVDLSVPVPEAPTRRPTPTFDIPAAEANTPTVTPSATPTFGPAIIYFEAAETVLRPGECTLVTWNVRNVLEVYYEGLGVPGEGNKEECIGDEDDTYVLLVVLPNGATEEHTVAVQMWVPTPTTTPTKTFTPQPVFTPTWTPQPPPPTAVITYGAELSVLGGSQQRCKAGSTCTIGLRVLNLGNQPDDLVTSIVQSGPWSSQICRLDGVCAAESITLYNIGPGSNGQMSLLLDLPPDASAQTETYTVQAFSGKTGNAVRSDEILIEVGVE